MSEKKPLGLDAPIPPKWFENNPCGGFLPDRYNPNGRAMFEALVPDRYKREEPKAFADFEFQIPVRFEE